MASTTFLAIKGKTTNISNPAKHEQITSAFLVRPNCYYEIVETNKNQRVFVDLDGKFNGSVEDFNALNKKITDALLSYGVLAGVRTASMYGAKSYKWDKVQKVNVLEKTENKLSFIITYRRMTADVATMKTWIINDELPRLQALFQGIIPVSTSSTPNELNVDTGVYSHHKVRCPNAWKETEQKERISKVLKGTIDENLIQNITNCEIIQSAPVAVAQIRQPPVSNFPVNPAENVIVVNNFNEVLRALCDKIPHNKWYNTPDWLQINFIWKNEGWAYDIFDEFSKKYGDDKYHAENNKRIWDSSNKKGLNQATLWGWLKSADINEFNTLQHKRSDFYTLIQNNINNIRN